MEIVALTKCTTKKNLLRVTLLVVLFIVCLRAIEGEKLRIILLLGDSGMKRAATALSQNLLSCN